MTRMFSLKAASSLRAALAASVCLLPLQAFAQSDNSSGVGATPAATTPVTPPLTNWITIGGQYDSGRSYYLGRFSGAVNPGFYGLGDLHYGYRDPWDSGGTTYFEMNGGNLGMWDRSFDAKVGQQGTWGLNFYYQGIPYYATNSFQSVYQGNGNLVPGVAPGSLHETFPPPPLVPKIGSSSSVWLPRATNSPAGSMWNYNLSTRRDIFGGGGKYQWGDWTITAGWRHEHKEGFQANSLEIGWCARHHQHVLHQQPADELHQRSCLLRPAGGLRHRPL